MCFAPGERRGEGDMNIQMKSLPHECQVIRQEFGESAISFETALALVKTSKGRIKAKNYHAMMGLIRNTTRRRHCFRFLKLRGC